MKFSWNQRLYGATRRFINHHLIDDESVQLIHRPLYFGQYKWTLHFSPTITNWTDFDDLLIKIHQLISGWDHKLVSSRKALYFNLYGNDPQILNNLRIIMSSELDFSSIRIISMACWHLTHPHPKNKGKFYHKFKYRIKTKVGIMTPNRYGSLMTGDWLISKTFFYCEEVRDVLLFKLIHAPDIIDIMER